MSQGVLEVAVQQRKKMLLKKNIDQPLGNTAGRRQPSPCSSLWST